MDRSRVILVDQRDEALGTEEKLRAHREGKLHRAFSIFILDKQGRMLLQQRAMDKYHSGGLWTNACCSHPPVEMDLADFARLRLKEEMGFETPLRKIFDFIYHAELDNELVEHEFDHVLIGEYEGEVPFNPEEVMAIDWQTIPAIEEKLSRSPGHFTAWFRIAFPRVKQWLEEQERQKLNQ